MFAIAAINDTDSKNQWEPLAPTKEAQEFHLSQTYHEGLRKLQAKEYEKARELLESVLKDPLVSSAQVDSSSSDGHLLQLRFLTLKNLATVFLQQGSDYHESALQCYLQAAEIDSKDSVVWNQLGTLSCSMGILSISRWAFEQGLCCSPNNWNCMEKLLEVLIAIGDEVACLSVAELILRHWPSHARALHVKNTIEETETIPFAPKGIDKLEPKHIRLKFGKRKVKTDDLGEGDSSKRLKENLDLHLPEASWTALAGALVKILLQLNGCDPDSGAEKFYMSHATKLIIHLPHISENTISTPVREYTSRGDSSSDKSNVFREKEAGMYEEHTHERRSSRLERLRSRKPGKEELDFSTSKDLAKVVVRFLKPFIGGRSEITNCSSPPTEVVPSPLDNVFGDVAIFVRKTSETYDAYRIANLLLEEVATKGISYQDGFSKFLELEKLSRCWGEDRSPECSLFLAELYYDSGSCSSEVNYHICKVIASVVLDYPRGASGVFGDENRSSTETFQLDCQMGSSLLSNKCAFWVRFFWLSGKLSLLDGDKAKAKKEFGMSLSLLAEKGNENNPLGSVLLPHCNVMKKLTADRVFHEFNLLEIDILLKEKTHEKMIEKDMYFDLVCLLAPLLFCSKNLYLGVSCVDDKEGEWIGSVELSALDVLIEACEKAKLMDNEIFLNCHRRKLQILMSAAGMVEYSSSRKPTNKMQGISTSETESKESPSNNWNHLLAEEVKVISRMASQMKSFINPCGSPEDFVVPMRIIGDIQSLLMSVMCSISSVYFSRECPGLGVSDQNEQQKCCFVDAAITFFKLQHFNPHVPIKTQIDLIVAIHDMLAEYGICCASGDGEEEDGTFLKLAIKHLLALDMKLKSNSHSLNRGQEMAQCDEQLSQDDHVKKSLNESRLDTLNIEAGQKDTDETSTMEEDTVEWMASNGISSHKGPQREKTDVECGEDAGHGPDSMFHKGEKSCTDFFKCGDELTEDEREELELGIDNALDQCFFCLYGLYLKSDSSCEDDLTRHKNTSRGDYQTKEQCADVFQYILPYAKASSKTGLVKLRKVLRAIRKHFPQPPETVLAGNAIDKFLDDPGLCEDKLSEEAGSDGFLDSIMRIIYPDAGILNQQTTSSEESSESYLEVYRNLYYLLAQSEETSATDKWAGFVLTKEGEEFVEQSAKLFKFDLLYNPLRFESWQRLANIYDEEVDLLLNDGSKQINVLGWRKNAILSQRVEKSRRRSRRCLLMTLALATTAVQQGEIHELLALVYYDGLQNVVPIHDQRSIIPSKDAAWTMFCQNSMRHFKKAFAHKEDWSYVYYLGKLCEKLGYSNEISFSFYDKAIALSESAVDPFYRMHASRLKLLCRCGKQNEEALKVVVAYSFTESTKESVMNIFGKMGPEIPQLPLDINEISTEAESDDKKLLRSHQLEQVWNMLYSDCLSALEICVEGDLKHFHKARYMLAQGLYRRGESGDLEKAKDELSFCFKSSRSSFTINMWEIDGMVKKGRRKTPGLSGNKRSLEVNLPESSRKFITCIRKYMLFYLQLLDEMGDISTLDRAYISLRTDKRFSLCLEDLVPLALGRYLKALISSIRQTEIGCGAESSSLEHPLEKMFSLFLEQVNLWSDICSLPEIKCSELSEANLYGYLYQYIQMLETNLRLETLEGINEKIRKRLKNPKLSNSNCAKVYKHVSSAWCRSLVINMSLITPLHSSEIQVTNLLDSVSDNIHLLCVDLQTDELWTSSFEDPSHLRNLETRWNPMLSKIKNVVVKRAPEEDLERVATLLRSSYNFYKDTSIAMLPSGVNLYMVPFQLVTEMYIQPGIDGVDILDMSTSRKLLSWAYTLLHGHCTNISSVVKYCEENTKSKMKKGTGSSSVPSSTSLVTTTASHTGCGKDGAGKCNEPEPTPSLTTAGTLPEIGTAQNARPTSLSETKTAQNVGSLPQTDSASNVGPASLHEIKNTSNLGLSFLNASSSNESQKILSANQNLRHCNNVATGNEVGCDAANLGKS